MPIAIPAARHFVMPQPINERLNQGQPVSNGVTKAKELYTEQQGKPLASKPNTTFAGQSSLSKLPIPELDSSVTKYLAALKPLQTTREHAETQQAAEEFLKNDGPDLQEKLKKYATGKTSYIEQFCE